ncbi:MULTISPECIES: MinD/ParA family ATP-binding protein [Mycolicibacterium]|jgi:MinD-like ATPase involved in chromosome partitioning or flagellar assembly|uniref:MinD/ParA family protein n=1 Tax=Mycolicibacterium nivoides TaxID=2487344 RepID=A0ABW9LMI1_9MYCO|nr:AAA family ATPase [Mycolicibacterium fortuitum]UBV13101.1 AAA family ATPase [Mycolicibacterium fortuitum]
MTVPPEQPNVRRMRDKYRNAPAANDFIDRPAPAPPPTFTDPIPNGAPVPPPLGMGGRTAAAAQWAPAGQYDDVTVIGRPAVPADFGRPVTPTDLGRPAATADTGRAERIIEGRTEGAQRGWRAKANKMFWLHLSKGADEIAYDQRIAQIRRTLRAPKRVGVISGKGSAGKTAIALNMGATISSAHRGMKVAALSIDPLGNLTDRVRKVSDQTPASVMSLASDQDLNRASDVSSYLLTDKSGLRVLGASTADGAGFLTAEKLERALGELSKWFDLSILDFGLNIDSQVYHQGLAQTDQLVLAASTAADSIDELHVLIETLKRFGGRYVELLRDAVVVFTQTRPGKGHIDVAAERDRIHTSYQLPVVTIPWDEHISEGGPMSLDLLDEDTRLPFVWLAAEVMSRLPAD